jgi:hypothetical protein
MAYGVGTKSFNASPENHAMKRERAEFTKKYEAGEIRFASVTVPLLCRCLQRPTPHELSVHATLASDWAAWGAGQSKNSWPWSLRFIGGGR